MCDSSVTQGLSTASTIYGTYQQMQAARNNANYQASVANQNAALAEAQAVSAGEQGAYQQSQIRQQARQVAASQKAGYSAAGLDIQAGTPLAVQGDTAYQSEQDIQASRYNTMLSMWGLDTQANNYRQQAQYAKQAGKYAQRTALLNGITSLAQQYSNYSGNKTTTYGGNNTTSTTTQTTPIYTDFAGRYSTVPVDEKGYYRLGNNYTPQYKRWF